MKWWLYLLPTFFALSPAIVLVFAKYLDGHLQKAKTKVGLWAVFMRSFFIFAVLFNLILALDMFFLIKRETTGWTFLGITIILCTAHKHLIVKKFPIEKVQPKEG